ncbi:glutathione synthetase-like isoform X1 [Lycorma delicatula]|uniref:glutathione synthetase-like isoform X1 n=1 Tax=Lycorma delicatula TaxID=130591 RepID=UPI003F50D676
MADGPRLNSCVPIPKDIEQLKDVIEKAKDWALMHGVGIRNKKEFNPDALQIVPFTFFPSAFPRKEFEKAVKIQPILNELIHRVAFCHSFLEENLKDTIQVDEFTGNLYKIYETVRQEGINPRLSLGSVRADMMLETVCCYPDIEEQSYCCWKQIEINTIASGFGWLGPAGVHLHRFILQELGHYDKLKNLPENRALEGVCGGLIEAWKLFKNPKAVILMVIEDVVYNICDQRFHEFRISELSPKTRVIRRTLTDLAQRATLDADKNLIIDNEVVAVVYYRSAYEPLQFHSQKEWDARLLAERSSAIKCPSIHYHLAGTKKVQQALARPGAVEQFFSDPEKVTAVRDVFTGLYSLDFDELGEDAVKKAIEKPERYVLKPQREGGGNNIYGEKIRDVITKIKGSRERTGWILMDRIVPPVQENIIIRASQPAARTDTVSELGIFGIIIGDSNEIIYNKQVGHMLRSKESTADEVGVSAGFGAMDSPYLY